MGRWTLLACLLGLFNLWCALVASRDSFSVSEEELLGVLRSFITLSWLGLLGKGMAGFFARSSSFRTTISKAVLSLEWLGLVGKDLARGCLGVGLLEAQNCLCWP